MGREVTAIRLDARTRARVARVAQRRGKTPSETMREVIESWVDQEEAALTPFERIEDLVGSFEGPGDLSTRGGGGVADDLKARRKTKKGQRKP